MTTIDYTIIGIYLFIISMVGLYAGRGLKDIREYAVAGRSYGSFVLLATLSASFIGGGFSFGNADTVFNEGLIVATALWGFSLMLILVSVFIAPHVDNFRDCISTGDILATQLGTPARILAGILGAIVCTGILAAQIGAIGAIFTQFTALSFMQGIFVGCGIVIVYTAFGGMKAVVLTDVIQFLFLFILIPLAFFLGIEHLGGFDEVIAKAPPSFFALPDSASAWFGLFFLFMSFVIGETLVPPYVQRLLITKSATATKRGILGSGLLSIPFFLITGSIGLLAYLIDPTISSNLAMPMVIDTVMPIGLKGLVAAAIISVVMSSADSFLNSASVCLIEDVIRPLIPQAKNLSPRHELGISQILTIFIGLGAVFIAIKIENVLDVLLFAYNFWAPVILIPLISVLMLKKITKQAFWVSAFIGITIVLCLFAFSNGKLFQIDALIVAVFFSGIAFFITNKITLNKINNH